jgi:Saxitoxin biosynthesis operon protein SxtJ
MQWSDVVAAPSPKVLRQFAGLCLVVFGSLAALALWRHHTSTATIVITGLGIATGLVGLLRPMAIRWVYSGWMMAVFPVGWTVSRLMLAALFYLIFTPVALLFRLSGRDVLHLSKKDPASDWTAKPEATNVDQYFRQF